MPGTDLSISAGAFRLVAQWRILQLCRHADTGLPHAGLLTFMGEHFMVPATTADLATCNAVIHMVSAVLLP